MRISVAHWPSIPPPSIHDTVRIRMRLIVARIAKLDIVCVHNQNVFVYKERYNEMNHKNRFTMNLMGAFKKKINKTMNQTCKLYTQLTRNLPSIFKCILFFCFQEISNLFPFLLVPLLLSFSFSILHSSSFLLLPLFVPLFLETQFIYTPVCGSVTKIKIIYQ